MKRFWLVLLSLGLIAAFSTSAFAVDVKVNGEFYVGGLYLNKTEVGAGHYGDEYSHGSTAFFYQRLRVGTDFVVSDCLKLVTRFDAMERIWGGVRSNVWLENNVMPEYSAGTRAESENIAFDNVYIEYVSPVGKFEVGYMPDSTWGTVFGNDSTDANRGMIKWAAPVGPVILLANYAKIEDNSSSAVSTQSYDNYINRMATKTDRDADSYRAGFIYPFKGEKANGQVGALFIYTRDASNRGYYAMDDYGLTPSGRVGYLAKMYQINPYFKANIGPVALQGELKYSFGDAGIVEHNPAYPGFPYSALDQKIDSLSVFLDAVAKFGMVSVGGTFAYLQGDNDPYDDTVHDVNTGGVDWNPCLILFNNDTVNYWIGDIDSGHDGYVGGPMKNAYFFQGRVGVKPTNKLDAMLSVSYASADKKSYHLNSAYGWEVDLTGTYKITNNLSYMLGVGYLFTGDYFKGDCEDGILDDDFILINKLTLNF